MEAVLTKEPLTGHRKLISIAEVLLIVGFALVPLFVSFPYRINIFLSWEGAYRMANGELPYKDFGLPMGYAFWLVPAMFFKLFGPYLITLVKAQVFMNILAGLSFRSILKSVKINPGLRLVSILVFCISYSFFNFWPWYNHTVIVFQLIGMAFLLKYLLRKPKKWSWLYMAGAGFFVFLSVFTKQDGGGLALMLCLALLLYSSLVDRSIRSMALFLGFFALAAIIFIGPFLPYGFSYWFNYGQVPHYSRLSALDFITEILGNSQWLKFYLLVVGLIVFQQVKSVKEAFHDKTFMVFFLMTLGILVEAALYQVTSYVPPDNNIFFHSFAFAFIMAMLFPKVPFHRPWVMLVACTLVMVWWSGTYWKYTQRIMQKAMPGLFVVENKEVVSKNTWSNQGEGSVQKPNTSEWVYTDLKAFQKVYMPESTVKGIEKLMNLPLVKEKGKALKVLNMTELTPLAYEMGFELPKSQEHPLWYHKGVCAFDKEVEDFCQKIRQNEYDLVLFEYLPGLNNFYPFEVRECLKKHYQQVDTFDAPRSDGLNPIEVFIRKEAPGGELTEVVE
ncbi:hypothetical protein AAG747_27165 [Rapidithrix thailandica]|uniref:Glycosyltransferase RgtA/B/C/D-like domain-containing protein n=1 Tax=Rapidithrix thailandica TaxID=413964 RepID=A0AAW9SGB2_9BACT